MTDTVWGGESLDLALTDRAIAWREQRADEWKALGLFVECMIEELAENVVKGGRTTQAGRPGWLTMNRKQAMAEIGWHLAKLQVAAKDLDARRGGSSILVEGEMEEAYAEAVREYAADVANCALMALDVMGLLFETSAPAGTSEGPPPARLSDAEGECEGRDSAPDCSASHGTADGPCPQCGAPPAPFTPPAEPEEIAR